MRSAVRALQRGPSTELGMPSPAGAPAAPPLRSLPAGKPDRSRAEPAPGSDSGAPESGRLLPSRSESANRLGAASGRRRRQSTSNGR